MAERKTIQKINHKIGLFLGLNLLHYVHNTTSSTDTWLVALHVCRYSCLTISPAKCYNIWRDSNAQQSDREYSRKSVSRKKPSPSFSSFFVILFIIIVIYFFTLLLLGGSQQEVRKRLVLLLTCHMSQLEVVHVECLYPVKNQLLSVRPDKSRVEGFFQINAYSSELDYVKTKRKYIFLLRWRL